MLIPSGLASGQEQYESFKSSITRKTLVQYDYRHTDGQLFSCVRPTLEACRKARDAWLTEKDASHGS